MSTATNASQCENPSDYVVAGIVSVINADTGRSPFPAYGPRLPERFAKNRVEVTGGSATRASDKMNQNANGDWYYDHKRVTVQVTVVSQRQTKANTGAETTHALAVGRSRWLCGRNAQRLTPNVVGGLQVVDVVDLGEQYSAGESFDVDRTVIRLQVDLVIPPSLYTDS